MSQFLNKFAPAVTIVTVLTIGIVFFSLVVKNINVQLDKGEALVSELSITGEDYQQMTAGMRDQETELNRQIEEQQSQIRDMEGTLTLHQKEEVLDKVATSAEARHLAFEKFYVTAEGNMRTDYSVEVTGKLTNINEFIQDVCADNNISIGEFSIRENNDFSYLNRFFDSANALSWYENQIEEPSPDNVPSAEPKPSDSPTGSETELTEAEKADVLRKLDAKIRRNPQTIDYVMTLTFRL